jgi:hypothetical protein
VLADPRAYLGVAGETLALTLQQLLGLLFHGVGILQARDEDRARMWGTHGDCS